MLDIMSERNKPENSKLTFASDTLDKYFPKTYTSKMNKLNNSGLLLPQIEDRKALRCKTLNASNLRWM